MDRTIVSFTVGVVALPSAGLTGSAVCSTEGLRRCDAPHGRAQDGVLWGDLIGRPEPSVAVPGGTDSEVGNSGFTISFGRYGAAITHGSDHVPLAG